MKKMISLLLLSTLIFSTVSCGRSSGTTPTATTESITQPDPEATELTLNESFTVVHAVNATDNELTAVTKIQNALKRIGIQPTVQDDTAPETPNEILVGNTARTASQNALSGIGEGGFRLAVSGDKNNGYKIILAANDGDGIDLCSGYFIFTYLNSETPTALPVSLFLTHKRAAITVNGTPLFDYTVVYAKEGIGSDKDIQAAKYADTVKEFVKLVEKATGTALSVIPDTENLSSDEKYILFGNTARGEDNLIYNPRFIALGINAYSVKLLTNGNLAVAGSNACSALAAGEAAVYAMLGKDGEVGEINRTGKKDIIHVACIGDSITYGTNSNDPSMQSYPVYLQRMLGYGYYVEKYGAPSHSLIETDTPSFLKHDYYAKSVKAKPDVVIVMLGTNDCRTQKWEDSAYKDWRDPARKEAFLSSGQKLIDAYRQSNPDVQIIFSTCPTVPQDAWLGTDWTARIRQYGNPTIRTLAQNNACPVIDIYTYSTKHPEMFDGGDGLHPQNEQYEILAKGVYELTADIIEK